MRASDHLLSAEDVLSVRKAVTKFRATDFPVPGEAAMVALVPDARARVTKPGSQRVEAFLSFYRSGSAG